MRDLDPARAERERQRHHVLDVINVGAVHHSVDGERDFEMNDFGGERALAGEGAFVTGDAVGGRTLAVLDRYLHVIKAGFGESSQSVQGDADCRGDEIGVKVGGMRRCHDRDEIAPRTRLAAGEMHLQDAERRGLLAAPEG